MSSGPQSIYREEDEDYMKEFYNLQKEEVEVLHIYLLHFLKEKL